MRSDRSGVSGKKKSLFDATICGQCPPSLLYSAGSLQLQIHLWSGFGSPCSKLKCRSSPTTLLNSLCGFLNLEMGEEKKKGKEHEREWRVRGWDGLKKTTRPQKTFGKQRHNQRGIMPHCGGWMCMIVCVCWRIWKAEGGGGGTHVMFEFNLIVNFQKNKTFFFVHNKMRLRWILLFRTQEMASGGKNPAQRWLCVTVSESAHKHLNARVLAKCDNMLPNLSVMHHVMADSVLVLAAGYLFVCMCLFSSQLLLVVCFMLSCCLQEAAFRTAWWVSWQDPLPPSQFLLGDNRRSHRAWRCVVVGIYWGSSGLPFRKL